MAPIALTEPSIVVGLHVDQESVRAAALNALTPANIATRAGAHAEADLLLVHVDVSADFDLPEPADRRIPIVVCAPPAGPRAVRKAVERGIDGLVWESHIESRLVPTVQAVAAGQLVVPREAWRP